MFPAGGRPLCCQQTTLNYKVTELQQHHWWPGGGNPASVKRCVWWINVCLVSGEGPNCKAAHYKQEVGEAKCSDFVQINCYNPPIPT